MKFQSRLPAPVIAGCAAALLLLIPVACVAQGSLPFYVQMRDSSMMQVQTGDSKFEWKTVAPDGSITMSTFNVTDIESLRFAASPASEQVARIRQLIDDLADDDYHRRNEAERILLAEGKPFETVIEQQRDHAEPEARYRIARLLENLDGIKESATNRFVMDFDILQLRDGRRLEGDIGDWSLTCEWNGVPVTANRGNCMHLFNKRPFAVTSALPGEASTVSTELMFDDSIFFDGENPRENVSYASFEEGEGGEKLDADREFDIVDGFAFMGGRFHCVTNNGRVVISGFRFKNGRSRRRSIGNFFVVPESKKRVSYQGEMRIDFCVPGNPTIPASVNRIGMFVEIVIPKHTILEAVNSAGHVVGLSQSVSDRTGYLSFDSNSDIAYVRLLANEYLATDDLNKDFAVDDLSFSRPTANPALNFVDGDEGHIVIVSRDDERLLARNVSFDLDNQILQVESAMPGVEDFAMPLDKVQWVVGPQSREVSAPQEDGCFVMLTDGSVVHCLFQQQLVASANPSLTIAEEDVIGVWGYNQRARYPRAADFDEGSMVMVRPLNTVCFNDAGIDWNNGRLDYQLDKAIDIQQGINEAAGQWIPADAEKEHLGIEPDADDPGTLDLTEVASIWTTLPPNRAAGTGLLRTDDGQQFILGGESGFELAAVNGSTITIRHDGQELSFDVQDIYALDFGERE